VPFSAKKNYFFLLTKKFSSRKTFQKNFNVEKLFKKIHFRKTFPKLFLFLLNKKGNFLSFKDMFLKN